MAKRSINVAQIVGADLEFFFGKKGLNDFREESALLQFVQRDPFHADLLLVVLAPGTDALRVWQATTKNVFDLMEGAVRMAEFMVLADIFPNIKKLANFDLRADFFKALPFQSFTECFPVPLSSSGENVEYTGLITHLDRE